MCVCVRYICIPIYHVLVHIKDVFVSMYVYKTMQMDVFFTYFMLCMVTYGMVFVKLIIYLSLFSVICTPKKEVNDSVCSLEIVILCSQNCSDLDLFTHFITYILYNYLKKNMFGFMSAIR